MTDEKIIEYVMDSPENTNPSVLDSMLKSNKVQPDWKQNDPTASDYIKNRPFYEEVTEVVMLPETSFLVAESDGEIGGAIGPFPYVFEVGKDYSVTFDGVTNTYTASLGNGGVGVICDTSLEEALKGNGWMCAVFNNTLILLSSDSSVLGTHTISISKTKTETHMVDSKYLPENEPLVLYAKQM